MSTARDLVEAALRELGELAAGEPMNADDAQEVLTALNRMVKAWSLEGIRIEHTDLALGDTFLLPPDHEQAIITNLAERIAPLFEAQPSAITIREARRGLRLLKTYYFNLVDVKFEPGLLDFQNNRSDYDISQG